MIIWKFELAIHIYVDKWPMTIQSKDVSSSSISSSHDDDDDEDFQLKANNNYESLSKESLLAMPRPLASASPFDLPQPMASLCR
jgi:hypothetical protein